ncbi:MAG: hypothetical protein Q9209_003576 [Squamulea sp. 1 TL-2023]
MDTTHRPAKRRFQTDITSYFNINDASNLTHPEKAALTSPQIPPTIQSSLLNVGGYKAQPAPETDAPSGMFFGDDLFGSMPSSQESIQELVTMHVHGEMPLMGAKRSFEVDEDDELAAQRAGKDVAYSGIMGNSSCPIALRPIAQARNRRPAATSKLKAACDGDFEEAPFLVGDFGEDMDFGN